MTEQPGVNPTIVVVHGAFADASSWNGVLSTALVQRQHPTRPNGETADGFLVGPALFRDALAAPSWAVVATGDKAAGSDVIRSMAQRAGADIGEVEGSHVIMVSQPQAVTDLKAARAVVGSGRR